MSLKKTEIDISKEANIIAGMKGLGKRIAVTSKSNAKKGIGVVDGAKNQWNGVKGYSASFARKNPGSAAALVGGAGIGTGYALNNAVDQRD